MLHLTDSHLHLTSSHSSLSPAEVIEGALVAGVKTFINICTNASALEAGLKLAERYPSLYNAGATHPEEVAQEGEESFAFFSENARQGKLIAIGETGLDYFHTTSPREQQWDFLRRYLELAASCDLPLVFHCRDAFDDLFRIVDEVGGTPTAVLHCFTGNSAQAAEAIRRGWYISFSGVVTYKKNDYLRAIAQELPLERLLIETDAPFLAPQSKRGKPNQPAYLVETAQVIADLRRLSLDEFATATTANAVRFFRLEPLVN